MARISARISARIRNNGWVDRGPWTAQGHPNSPARRIADAGINVMDTSDPARKSAVTTERLQGDIHEIQIYKSAYGT